jgi:hypothetical protein
LGGIPFDYDIEIAEVQIWSGVTLDTSNVGMRRFFVNEKGKPSLKYKDVDQALGKPVVRLHGIRGLKNGHNSGTLQDFEPEGEIEKYKPDPSLFGKQFPDT